MSFFGINGRGESRASGKEMERKRARERKTLLRREESDDGYHHRLSVFSSCERRLRSFGWRRGRLWTATGLIGDVGRAGDCLWG